MKNEIAGFSSRLTEKMEEQGMTQADLCKLTGLSTSMISHYCTGQRIPTIPVAIKITKALNTTVEYLATGISPHMKLFSSSAFSVAEKEISYSSEKTQIESNEQLAAPLFYSLNLDGQAKVLAYIEDLLSTGKYN